jgi:hypothetical protein
MLSFYEKRAKLLPTGQLLHALRDIQATLAIWQNRPLSDPYIAKLYAEYDAYSVERYKRQRNALNPKKENRT